MPAPWFALFRREAVEHRQDLWLGGVQFVRPLPLSLMTGLLLAATLAVALFLSFGQYTRKVRVAGYLVPGTGIVRLLPQESGTVLERRAIEGQLVRQGEVLFVLAVDRSTLNGDTEDAVKDSLAARERSLRAASRQQTLLSREQDLALEGRIAAMRQELAQLAAEADLQRRRLALARASQARFESLRAENFVSEAQVHTKAEEALAVESQLQALGRQHTSQSREIATLEAQRRELPLRTQVAQGEIDRDLATLSQEAAQSESRQHRVVRAPQDGVLTAVMAEPGQAVGPGVALASLVPAHAQLQADLYAPSSAVGFLRPQQQVQLRYDAFPFQRYGHRAGRVVAVSRTPLQASELAALPLPGALSGSEIGVGTEPLYRVTVALDEQFFAADGHDEPLVAGMQLQADVMLERRRLVEWLFEPLLAAARRV